MKKLIEGLRHFQEHVLGERKELFERSIHGQSPQALLITCSDSRVLPETLLQADPGDLFISRNAGNVVPPPEAAGGEAATIEYAVSNLGVADIIVCGHYRCGAVKALLDDSALQDGSPVRAWLTHASQARVMTEQKYGKLQGESQWDRAVEQNVLLQLAHLAKHPVVATGLADGTLQLHAWVLRFETGEIVAYDSTLEEFAPLLETPLNVPCNNECGCCNAESKSTMPPQPTEPRAETPSETWLASLKSDIPSSLVLFAVALPLCVAIAKTCAVPTAAGIVTAIIGGILVGILGGGYLQVSGPTASLIVTVMLVRDQVGLASLGLIVVLAGTIQIVAGILRLGQWFRAVSPAVILGMLAGIGVVLFSQQFHVTVDDSPVRSPLTNLLGVPSALWYTFDGHDGHPEHLFAAAIGLMTLAVLLLWKLIVPRRLQSIPAVLVAVVGATIVATAFELPVQRVQFDSLAAAVTFPEFSDLMLLLSKFTTWQFAFTIAIVASAETLLTASAVDAMHNGSRTGYDRELAAQGVGNIVCGMFGALPMASVIVRSSANIQAGARSRLSTVLHGFWLLLFVVLGAGLLRLIPTAALAAALVFTSIRMVQYRAIHALWRESKSEGMICLAVASTVVGYDLLAGVVVGMALSLARLVYGVTCLNARLHGDAASGRMTLVLSGAATFLGLPKLASLLESVSPATALHVDHDGLNYIDHASLAMLIDWKRQHESKGGELMLNTDQLRTRLDSAHFPRHARAPHFG